MITSQVSESTLVRKINFQGNRSVKSKTLMQLVSVKIKEPLYEIMLDKDVENLQTWYTQQGFEQVLIETEVKTEPKGKQVNFKIQEGLRTKIGLIKLQGIESVPLSKIEPIIKLRRDDDLVISKINQTVKAIVQWYKNNGYPYINVETDINRQKQRADITFIVNEGGLAYIKALFVRGNQKVTNKVILVTTEIKEGEKFSLEKLEKARQRLYASRLFERVSFYILESDYPDSLHIRFDVLELPPRSIGFGIGFQTPPSGLLFSTEWQHLNFLSRRHNLFIAASYTPTFSGDWQSEIKSSYKIFHFLTTPVNFTFQPSFKYEKIDSLKQDELNIEAGISRYIGPQFEVGTFLRYLRVWTNYPLAFISDYRSITNSQNLFIRFDSRDNLFIPASGIFFTTNLQYAGSIYTGDNDFYKNQTEFILFRRLFPQLVIGCRTLAGITVPYGRTAIIPYYETFSLGGNNGLRGYNDKSVGPTVISNKYHYGEAIINANLELRTHFEKLIDFVMFFDAGKVTNHRSLLSFNNEMLNYSAGLGIRINTPFGPIRLDYAKRLKDAPSEDWGKFHLGLLNIF
jgi:outer membrane protein insertion porin family